MPFVSLCHCYDSTFLIKFLPNELSELSSTVCIATEVDGSLKQTFRVIGYRPVSAAKLFSSLSEKRKCSLLY